MKRRAIPILAALLLIVGGPSRPDPPAHPDLIVDGQTLSQSWWVERFLFPPGDCAVSDGCLLAAGLRTVLRFDTVIPNISQTDMVLGDPSTNNDFVYDPCHGHYHLRDFAEYQLVTLQGAPVTSGRKQGFCLIDEVRYLNESWVPLMERFTSCSFQGLQRGWGVAYGFQVPCQWIDVTGVAPGDYLLEVTTNPTQRYTESDYTNNTAVVQVYLPDLTGDPDLTVDSASVATSWRIEKRFFPPGDCAVTAGCVGGYGYRKLLSFSSRTVNLGPNDLLIGQYSSSDPSFAPDACNGFPRYRDFARFRLLDTAGNSVGPTRRQGMWLKDSQQVVSSQWAQRVQRFINTTYQGISRGWASDPSASESCLWLDVTGVPDGAYRLEVTVNPDAVVAEADLANNSATIAVTVAEPPGVPHLPDGYRVPGDPMTVERQGSALLVTYDVVSCAASGYNLYYGFGAPVSSGYAGGVCDIGANGSALVSLPDPPPGGVLWFNVVPHEGPVEGGHGYDSAGNERPLSGVGFCGITSSQPTPICLQ